MGRNQLKKLTLLTSLLALLLFSPIQTALAQSTEEETTCTLDASTSECSSSPPLETNILNDGMHEVISLTDVNFDELTWTTTPSTWLIMFKTDACGICKKALPELEKLSVDPAIIGHNEDQKKQDRKEVVGEEEPVNGPIYIATVDANWHGRDVTKRFEVDAIPTIIVLRNEGFDSTKYQFRQTQDDNDIKLFDMSGQKMEDTRTYYTYRGQRAQYPLRTFVLGGYTFREQKPVPPPLSSSDRKPSSLLGQIYDYTKPYLSVILKLLAAWFTFLGCLGLFMRIHNYAWKEEDDDTREREMESEKAKGRREAKENQDERAAERQKKMWEKKMENRAKFAKKKELRKKMEEAAGEDGENDDHDDFVGIGFSVKKSDIKAAKGGATSKNN
jgi:hypothetical protein